MSESRNISFDLPNQQQQQEASVDVLVPKKEPQDENNNEIINAEKQMGSRDGVGEKLEPRQKKLAAKVDDESDFDPENLTEAEDDFSIPESERDSFASYERFLNSKHRRSKYYDETEDEFFAELPRRKLKRSCKTSASRAILRDVDMESSTSPEEFDERIHVKVKSHDEKVAEAKQKLKEREELRAAKMEERKKESVPVVEKASKDVANSGNAAGHDSKDKEAKIETIEGAKDVEMDSSPTKKVKCEPIDETIKDQGDTKDCVKAEQNN